jgi:putative ABC transport system permease protein
VVACLGLLGLSVFVLSKKSKEISIRKVLGANVLQVVWLVTKEYFRLILVACLLALPVAYWLMSSWLESYAFRIDIGWQFFALPVVGIVAIAALTVSWQSLRAAMANPVNALRSE